MQTISIRWDDHSCDRAIDLNVTYSVNGDEISIEDVVPTGVAFPGQPSKSLGVHTESGRRHLASKVDANSLPLEIEKRQAVLA